VSTGVRVPHHEAERLAEGIVETLRPGCERVEVAGSIRRGTPTVGDIEIVAIPKITTGPDPSVLFGDPIETNLLDAILEGELRDGYLVPSEHPRDGERYKAFTHATTGLGLDLFLVRPPAQWGVIFTIRTGPAKFSQWLVTEARRRGFHVIDGALHRGSLGCSRFSTCDVLETPEESDLFEALGMAYLVPAARR